MNEVESVRITTVVDNEVWKEGLVSSWGLSFYVETFTDGEKYNVLMDTNGSFQIFFGNASKLGLNLSEVKSVFISHWHSDHYGALSQILPLIRHSTPVYVPSVSLLDIKEIMNAGGEPIICSKCIKFMNGLMSTGVIPSRISEHSLLINLRNKGLIVLVGCSHPGIINILKHTQKVSGVNKVFAVIGGLHISSVTEGITVGKFLQKIAVELVSPCHCTSNDAKQGIAKIMGERCVKNGSGKIILIS